MKTSAKVAKHPFATLFAATLLAGLGICLTPRQAAAQGTYPLLQAICQDDMASVTVQVTNAGADFVQVDRQTQYPVTNFLPLGNFGDGTFNDFNLAANTIYNYRARHHFPNGTFGPYTQYYCETNSVSNPGFESYAANWEFTNLIPEWSPGAYGAVALKLAHPNDNQYARIARQAFYYVNVAQQAYFSFQYKVTPGSQGANERLVATITMPSGVVIRAADILTSTVADGQWHYFTTTDLKSTNPGAFSKQGTATLRVYTQPLTATHKSTVEIDRIRFQNVVTY